MKVSIEGQVHFLTLFFQVLYVFVVLIPGPDIRSNVKSECAKIKSPQPSVHDHVTSHIDGDLIKNGQLKSASLSMTCGIFFRKLTLHADWIPFL